MSGPGVEQQGFPATRHSIIEQLRAGGSTVRRQALGDVDVYWKPVYTHLRLTCRLDPEDAQDATQGCFAEQGALFRRPAGPLPWCDAPVPRPVVPFSSPPVSPQPRQHQRHPRERRDQRQADEQRDEVRHNTSG